MARGTATMYDDDDLYVTEICDIDFEFKYIERWQQRPAVAGKS